MKYFVSMAIDGRVDVEVEANSFKEAKDKVYIGMCGIDTGDIDIIGYHPVNAQAENGDFVDY